MEMDPKVLMRALEKVQPGLASAEVIEQSTSFVFKEGRVITYNDEVAVSCPCDLANEVEGAVSSKELMALIRRIKDESVDIQVEDGELRITARKIKAGIAMDEDIHLPILSFQPEDGWFELPDAFLDGLKVCLFSAAPESMSPVLSNIHMKNDIVESCDNFRLTRFDMKEDSEDDILIPSRSARHLIKTGVEEYGGEEGWLFFREKKSDMIIAVRTYEDDYPDLESFLEVKDPKIIQMPGEIMEVLERSDIFASQDEAGGHLVDVEVKDNWLKVRSANDQGWMEEKARTKTGDADLYFAVNPNILRDILKVTSKAAMTDRLIKFEASDFVHVVTLMEPEK